MRLLVRTLLRRVAAALLSLAQKLEPAETCIRCAQPIEGEVRYGSRLLYDGGRSLAAYHVDCFTPSGP